MLAEHPEVLRRLRQEILEKIGSQRRPTHDDFRDMKFLRAVINGAFFVDSLVAFLLFGTETLRLYHIVCVVLLSQLYHPPDRLSSQPFQPQVFSNSVFHI